MQPFYLCNPYKRHIVNNGMTIESLRYIKDNWMKMDKRERVGGSYFGYNENKLLGLEDKYLGGVVDEETYMDIDCSTCTNRLSNRHAG
jgi:hypothetical protein